MASKINFIGSKTKCNIEGFLPKASGFYNAFSSGDLTFCVGEFVMVTDEHTPKSRKIAKLLSVYYSNELRYQSLPHRGSVMWYIFAEDMHNIVKNCKLIFDKKNEVVEYIRQHNVSLKKIVNKCNIIFGTVNDSKWCIEKIKVDPNGSFFCRYKIHGNKVIPIFNQYKHNPPAIDSVLYSILENENCENLVVVVTSDTDTDSENDCTPHTKRFCKSKRKTIQMLSSDEASESDVDKMGIKVKSPLSSSKNLRLSPRHSKNGFCKVTSPPPYSIIKAVDDENSNLKMTLKVMNYFRPVHVYPTKIDNAIMNSNSPIKVDDVMKTNNCIVLSQKATLKYMTPQNEKRRETLHSSSQPTSNYPPKRRSVRLSSKWKCNYDEANDSLILNNILEENNSSIMNTSLESTPKQDLNRQNKHALRKRLEMTTPPSKTRRNNVDSFNEYVPNGAKSAGCSSTKDSHTGNNNKTIEKNRLVRTSVSRLLTPNEKPLKGNKNLKNSSYIRYSAENLSSVKKILRYDDEDDDTELCTPKRKIVKPSLKSSTKNASSIKVKIREGLITPSIPARNRVVHRDDTPLSKAKTKLHVSNIPQALPCRENEFDNISNFLIGKLCDGSGGCMYISGVPGTGKTATVTGVVQGLEEYAKKGDISKFVSVNVNCMRLSEPRQAYVEIAKQLLGKTTAWEQAQSLLEEKFVSSKSKSLPIVLVIDEKGGVSIWRCSACFRYL